MFNSSRKVIQRLTEKLKLTVEQRDTVKQQRDTVRQQRDEARTQRNKAWEYQEKQQRVLNESAEKIGTLAAELAATCKQYELQLESARVTIKSYEKAALAIEVPPGTIWPPSVPPSFYADHMAIWHKHPGFIDEEKFQRAYRRGMQSGHHIARAKGSTTDLHIEWRVHVLLWAAMQGTKIPGDFVECGVNTGIFSLAICDYLDFNTLPKRFWLFDTFEGVPEDQMTEDEIQNGMIERNHACYSDCYEQVKTNFTDWHKAIPVRGKVPESLPTVDIDRIAYLSLDMNIAYPEIEAIKYFWPKLSPGACVVIDDYGWQIHSAQQRAFDVFAIETGVTILNLPTGQGLMIKP